MYKQHLDIENNIKIKENCNAVFKIGLLFQMHLYNYLQNKMVIYLSRRYNNMLGIQNKIVG